MFNPFWVHNKVSVYLFVTCIATIIYHFVNHYNDQHLSKQTILEIDTRISTSFFVSSCQGLLIYPPFIRNQYVRMPKSKRKKRSKSKSGYIGVRKTSSGKYQAKIWIKGKWKIVGSSYKTAKQAAKAYDKEAIRSRKPLSTLNYPKKAPVGYTPIQKPIQSNKAVGYRGVSKNGKFKAGINIGGKNTYIGTYDTAKEAAIAYDRAVHKANQSKSLLNFPDMVHNLDVEPKRKTYKRSSTGYKGVTEKANGKFVARFTICKKTATIGNYDTAIKAALAYDQAAIKAGRKKSTLNFPDGLPIKQESDIDDSEGFWV
jgi:hypothetical protein